MFIEVTSVYDGSHILLPSDSGRLGVTTDASKQTYIFVIDSDPDIGWTVKESYDSVKKLLFGVTDGN